MKVSIRKTLITMTATTMALAASLVGTTTLADASVVDEIRHRAEDHDED